MVPPNHIYIYITDSIDIYNNLYICKIFLLQYLIATVAIINATTTITIITTYCYYNKHTQTILNIIMTTHAS